MNADLDEEEINLDEVLQERFAHPPYHPATRVAAATSSFIVAEAPCLNIDIRKLVAHVEPPSSQELIVSIFSRLARLLDYLQHIENGLSQNKTLEKTVILFKLVNTKSLSLRDYITTEISRRKDISKNLRDVLDLTSYAINHELRRVFEKEFPHLATNSSTVAAPAPSTRAELTRAYGLLHNCFQQSIITLAQTFNPKLDGAILFDDYKIKVEQSIELDRELASLLQQVRRAEKEAGVLLKLSLINRVKMFRDHTMHYLMYKDWEVFEGFVAEIVKTYDAMENLAPVMHKFGSYLETLLQHVRMRAVLSNYYPPAQQRGFSTKPASAKN